MQAASNIIKRQVGNLTVPPLGYGLMSMVNLYTFKADPAQAEKEHLELLTRAADLGNTFWDTSDLYGPFTNEELIGKWFSLTGRRKEITLATKFGVVVDFKTYTTSLRGDKEYVREALDASLKRLQTDYVDLYYQHRVDKTVRIEETAAALAELIKEGKIKNYGLSECSAKTLRRAHAVHPVAAVQMEYSLFSLDIEREEIGIKKACDELGVAIVAYSPLGRGMLTGRFKSRADFEEKDWRLAQPRFSEENFSKNLDLVNRVVEMAQTKGCTPGQLALAWLMKQGENVIPIPGTRQLKNMEENWGSQNVKLTDQESKELRQIAETAEVKGQRYDPRMAANLFADTVE